MQSHFGSFAQAVTEYRAEPRVSARNSVTSPSPFDTTEFVPLWRFLRRHTAAEDRQVAYWTLANHGNELNRAAAAAILANFPQSDSTWWAVVDAMTDRNDEVEVEPWVRDDARRLLVRLTGQDFGYDRARWGAWLREL